MQIAPGLHLGRTDSCVCRSLPRMPATHWIGSVLRGVLHESGCAFWGAEQGPTRVAAHLHVSANVRRMR